jgi:hypothetical protein
MSAEHKTPAEQFEIGHAVLADLYQDAVAIMPVGEDDPIQQRLQTAGMGLATVLFENGSVEGCTYVFEQTAYTLALEQIFAAEEAGQLPAGSHERAVDGIIMGTFSEDWSAFLSRER